MRKENVAGFASVERRLDKLEAAHLSFRQALSGDSLLSKLVTGEFEERIGILKRKVRELEGQK
jgi:uncharacterized small protein (DUF1192 family)